MKRDHMKVVRKARYALSAAVAASTLAFAALSPAHATYEAGVQAYKNGQYQLAVDLWERYAVAGDVRSMKILGDYYSGETIENLPSGEVPVNITKKARNVEALYWYTLAAVYEFPEGLREPTSYEVSAKILAHNQLPVIRSRMKNAEVKSAEKRVAQKFESGSPHDLYRLGDMYQKGLGVTKDNVKAYQMYALAFERGGVQEAGLAFEYLKESKLLSAKEVEKALANADNWQPPLPPEHKGRTKQQEELERVKKELQEIKMSEALEAVSDIDVELIQRGLNALGFRAGVVDNRLGPSTRAAIRRFQYATVAKDPKLTEDEKQAVVTGVLTPRQTVKLFKDAAGSDHPMSQYVYGIMHVRGIGVEQNGKEAVKWLEKAADQNLSISHYALGVIFRDGTTGLNEVSPDERKSALHFAQASALGFKPANDALRRLSFEYTRDIE